MTVSITIDRKSVNVLVDIKTIKRKHEIALKNALNDIGSEVVNETANLIFNGPKTGRIYQYRGARHQASSPGEAPANRTGRLAKSVDYKVRSHNEMTVGESAEYAGFLENGTRKMKPRPHLIVAVQNNARNTELAILEAVEQEIS